MDVPSGWHWVRGLLGHARVKEGLAGVEGVLNRAGLLEFLWHSVRAANDGVAHGAYLCCLDARALDVEARLKLAEHASNHRADCDPDPAVDVAGGLGAIFVQGLREL